MNIVRFIGLFLLVLLAMFVCYGIYFAVVAYFFFIKLLAMTAVIAVVFYLFIKIRRKDLDN